MDILRELSPALILLFNEGLHHSNISVEYRAELLATDHLNKGLLVGVRYLSWFLQILEVLALAFQVVFQILHVLERSDPLK